MSYPQTRARWIEYGLAVTVTAATLVLRLMLTRWITADRPLLVLCVIPILISAYVGGLGPGLLSTALIALGADLLPFPPASGLAFTRPQNLAEWLILLGTGVLASVFCEALQRARNRAERIVPDAFGTSTDTPGREHAKANQAWLAAIVDSSDDAIISEDLNGLVTSWNEGATRLFGFSAAEALSRPMTMLIPPERAHEEREILARIGRGERIKHFETVRITKDGTRLDISATISPVRNDRGEIIGASRIARDITERRKAAETLAASERQYRLIFEESPLPRWIYDLETLRFLAVNKASQAHYGYTEAEFLQMTILDIRPAEDVSAVEQDVAQARGYASRSGEWRHRRKDGSIIHVIVSAHDIPFRGRTARLVAVQDITERKSAEAKLRTQLAQLNLLNQITRAISERQDLQSIFQVVVRSLEDNLPIDLCCMCLYDPADHMLTVVRVGVHNAALATELALTEHAKIPIDENGLSRCVRGELVHEPDILNVKFPFPQRLARAGLRSLVFAPLLVESKVFGVFIGARHTPRSFGSGECEFLKQVSEHTALAANQAQLYGALQRAYDDLRQTQQAIMQQERLRALGQMASGIAHDINNAITPAALYTESLLETEANLSVKARERLDIIQRALGDVAQTVARMREFYRQREPQLQLAAVDLNQLVPQIIELSRARWYDIPQQRGTVIEVRTELAPELPAIMGVESEIREALTNLVFNAVDAMPEGGTLTLRTRLLADASPPHAAVEVADTGVGMDAETCRRCLEPFFTTKGERGTGLGLAMVYGVVQRHSADIQIDSVVGQGTTMRLSFAAVESVTAPTQPMPANAPRARLRLLIIDDDPLLIKSLCDTLEADGHVVVAANGGRGGIDAFRDALARKEPFDAVITDLGMPYVDGRKVASEIKASSPGTPVILLTGWGQRLAAEDDVPPHVDHVLAKPPKLRELRETLARCCRS
jgi:PAS domain S-box-containing protein